MDPLMDVSQLAHISHLNRAQKRALILRDQLKYRDQRHLDTFLIGVVHPEPPVYQRVNGKVHPPLTEVSLKEGATKFDLGNVKFDEGKTIFRVHLTIEGGHCEMRESEALPLDEDNLDSIPIHQFIAKNMIPLFMVKYEAIHMRKRNINEARHFAYNALNLPKIRFSEGKTLSKLREVDPDRNGSSATGKNRKRAIGEPVPRHSANKRKRIGLDCIPDNVKSETFGSIPDQIKIDLFNTVVKTAFPNFDNLMMASWNVVSVYSNSGSEDPELDRAIKDLSYVLREFEGSYGKPKPKSEPQEKASRERISSAQDGHVKDSSRESAHASGRGQGGSATSTTTATACAEHDPNDTQQNRPVPRFLQMTRNNEETAEEEVSKNARYDQVPESQQAVMTRYIPERQTSREDPAPSQYTPEGQEDAAFHVHKDPRRRNIEGLRDGHVQSSRGNGASMQYSQDDPQGHTMLDNRSRVYEQDQRTANDPRLQSRMIKSTREDRRQIYTDGGLDKLFEGEGHESASSPTQQMRSQDNTERQLPSPVYLGQSKLGAPKQPASSTGSAPIAPMMHNRKEANGGERRGH